MKSTQQTTGKTAAFSLLELLVAVAIFSVLLVVLLAMTTGTNLLTSQAGRNIDASAKIRAVMDRLATDLEHAVTARETPIFISQDEENQGIHFLSRVDGYDGERPLAVVRYQVGLEPNYRGSGQSVYLMKRAAEGTSMGDPTLKNAVPIDGVEYDTLAQDVFRFVLEFIGKDGQPLTPGSDGEIPWNDVSAVVVCVAAIDDRATAIAPSADWPGLLPGGDFSLWQQRIDSMDFSQLPPEAARGIQIRRRVIPVPGKT